MPETRRNKFENPRGLAETSGKKAERIDVESNGRAFWASTAILVIAYAVIVSEKIHPTECSSCC